MKCCRHDAKTQAVCKGCKKNQCGLCFEYCSKCKGATCKRECVGSISAGGAVTCKKCKKGNR